MTDSHSKEVRSYNMSRIRSANTKPEIMVRKFLFSKGFRYRLHGKKLPGKPDIVLSKFKIVIFVHGCFWHGHENCNYYVIPKSNTQYWVDKINNNKIRDLKYESHLKKMGWRVFIIYECELKRDPETALSKLLKRIVH